MGVYLLSFVLLLLMIASYRVNRRRLRPSIALLLPVFLSASILILLQSYIQYSLSMLAVVILSFMTSFYVLGEFVSSLVDANMAKKQTFYELQPKRAFKIIALTIIVLNLFVQYRFIRDVGAVYGASDFLSSYAANRLNTLELQKTGSARLEPPGYLNYISFLAVSLEIICLHILLLDKLVFKKKLDRLMLTAVVLYFVSIFFNSGRAAFVPFIIHLLYLIIMFSKKSIKLLIKEHKLFITTTLFVMIGVFLFLGNLREKSSLSGEIKTEVDGAVTTAIYIGGPLVGFDIYINKGMPPYDFKGLTPNEYVGQNIFKGIYDVLRKIGIDTKRPVLHEEKYYLKVIEGNVYTGFCHFIRDFGLFGSIICIFIFGTIIGHVDTLIKKNRIGFDNVIGYYAMSWIYFSLLAMFYTNEFYFLFSVDFILYRCIIIFLFIRFGVKRIKIKCSDC